MEDDAWGAPFDSLRIWELHVDWADPNHATFNEVTRLPTAPFDSAICSNFRECIDQPNGEGLDAISDRLMYRLQYRNFGSYQTLVGNRTVDATGTDQAGVYWYRAARYRQRLRHLPARHVFPG